MEAFILAGIFVVSGILCHFIAKRFDRRPVIWGFMGCVLGPFALACLLISGKRLKQSA